MLTTLPRTHKNLVSSCLFFFKYRINNRVKSVLVAFDKLRLCSHRLVCNIVSVCTNHYPDHLPLKVKGLYWKWRYYYSITRCVDISNLSSAEPLFLRRTPSLICLPPPLGKQERSEYCEEATPYVADVAISRKRHRNRVAFQRIATAKQNQFCFAMIIGKATNRKVLQSPYYKHSNVLSFLLCSFSVTRYFQRRLPVFQLTTFLQVVVCIGFVGLWITVDNHCLSHNMYLSNM